MKRVVRRYYCEGQWPRCLPTLGELKGKLSLHVDDVKTVARNFSKKLEGAQVAPRTCHTFGQCFLQYFSRGKFFQDTSTLREWKRFACIPPSPPPPPPPPPRPPPPPPPAPHHTSLRCGAVSSRALVNSDLHPCELQFYGSAIERSLIITPARELHRVIRWISARQNPRLNSHISPLPICYLRYSTGTWVRIAVKTITPAEASVHLRAEWFP